MRHVNEMTVCAMLSAFLLVACHGQKPAYLPCDEELNQQATDCPVEDFMQFNNVDDDHHR